MTRAEFGKNFLNYLDLWHFSPPYICPLEVFWQSPSEPTLAWTSIPSNSMLRRPINLQEFKQDLLPSGDIRPVITKPVGWIFEISDSNPIWGNAENAEGPSHPTKNKGLRRFHRARTGKCGTRGHQNTENPENAADWLSYDLCDPEGLSCQCLGHKTWDIVFFASCWHRALPACLPALQASGRESIWQAVVFSFFKSSLDCNLGIYAGLYHSVDSMGRLKIGVRYKSLFQLLVACFGLVRLAKDTHTHTPKTPARPPACPPTHPNKQRFAWVIPGSFAWTRPSYLLVRNRKPNTQKSSCRLSAEMGDSWRCSGICHSWALLAVRTSAAVLLEETCVSASGIQGRCNCTPIDDRHRMRRFSIKREPIQTFGIDLQIVDTNF